MAEDRLLFVLPCCDYLRDTQFQPLKGLYKHLILTLWLQQRRPQSVRRLLATDRSVRPVQWALRVFVLLSAS